MDKEVHTCIIVADMDKNQPNGKDNDNQEGLDLLPFHPDYQEVEAHNEYQIFLNSMTVNSTITTFCVILK